ncbi:MAG: 50S ribosomal protein L24e [Candidatus Marsarchaeota archaeon]|nr:50S ribosomal protein L24e [Candidatus Marsarchaeota archaeon]
MKCSNCSKELDKGTGLMFVKKTGDIYYYCSSKCYKNHYIMGRKINPKLVTKGVKVHTAASSAKAESKAEAKKPAEQKK